MGCFIKYMLIWGDFSSYNVELFCLSTNLLIHLDLIALIFKVLTNVWSTDHLFIALYFKMFTI